MSRTQLFAGSAGFASEELLHAHVVEDQQVGFEVAVENPVVAFEGLRTGCLSGSIRNRSSEPPQRVGGFEP